jgi:hypothetical protein
VSKIPGTVALRSESVPRWGEGKKGQEGPNPGPAVGTIADSSVVRLGTGQLRPGGFSWREGASPREQKRPRANWHEAFILGYLGTHLQTGFPRSTPHRTPHMAPHNHTPIPTLCPLLMTPRHLHPPP